MLRAYSVLEIKSVDEDQRIIEGFASTPTPDRMGDVLDPKGADFTLPMPLLWQHRQAEPIGQVLSAEATSAGIKIRAKIAKDVLPRIDEAWALIKAGLVRGLSVGFTPDHEKPPKWNPETGGLHFNAWKWLELSAVTIPANADATITAIKSISQQETAALGPGPAPVVSASARGRAPVVRASRAGANKMKTYKEQIQDLDAKRVTAVSDRDAIQQKVTNEGRTKDAAEREAFDALSTEIAGLDAELADLMVLDAEAVTKAAPVAGANGAEAAAARGRTSVITVKQNLPPGMEFCRMVLCKAAAYSEFLKGNIVSPLQIAKYRYPDNPRIQQYLEMKTAVAGGTTTDTNTHASLLAQATVLEAEFLEYLRPQTIIGKFGTNGIPSLKRVPFNVKIQSQTTAASAAWVGEGKGKPVTKFQTSNTTLLFTKIAAIAVISDELARFSQPGAEGVVRDELARAVIERQDTDFIDPDKAASSGVNPASITNGVTALSSAGVSAANVLTDLQNLLSPFLVANYDVSDLVLIMPNTLALVLSLMENSLGQPAFSGIGLNGGTLRGIPVITSQYAANASSYGNMVIAVSARNIALADDGRVTVDASREASIEMSDAPGQDATVGTGASMVSMFQTNSIALRAEREINWKKLRTTAVKFMDDVNWGSIGSPA